MKAIVVHSKRHGTKEILVDDSDFEWLNQWKWCISKLGGNFYASRIIYLGNKKRERVTMHRLILGLTDSKIFGEHKDHNGLNNQRANLRRATNSQNQKNKRPRGSSSYLGVHLSFSDRKKANEKWIAQIKINGTPIYLGSFKVESDAAKAYDRAAKKYHGDFANLNFK